MSESNGNDDVKNLVSIVIALCLFVVIGVHSKGALAADRDQEVVAFADKAITHIEKLGKEHAYRDFSDLKGEWVRGDIYVVVLDTDGYSLFNPNNPRFTGKNFTNFADTNGKLWVKEMNEQL